MQNIASEMNLSETAFVYPKKGTWSLRWFTPGAEVDLCGHATLATAHILWSAGKLPETDPALFDTLSGQLVARRVDGLIELDFPTEDQTPMPVSCALMDTIGSNILYLGKANFDLMIRLADESAVKAVNPDSNALIPLAKRLVVVTAPSDDPQVDFVSRAFGPAVGIKEDPVTGSSHCYLAPYWKQELNKGKLIARQISERGGHIQIRLCDDRVYLAGEAVTIFSAKLTV